MGILRFSASKVALMIGLHDYGSITDEVLECVYQDQKDLLRSDAAQLQRRLVSKDEEFELLIQKSGEAQALQATLLWAKDRAAPAYIETVARLLKGVDKRLIEAQKRKKLASDEVQEVRKLLAQKVHTSVGTCNESVAVKAYERQTGSKVRHTNDYIYILTFPPVPKVHKDKDTEESSIDYSLLAEKSQCTKIRKKQQRLDDSKPCKLITEDEEAGYFSICGMVDGITETLTISADDEWKLIPVVVEVKTRMHGFRNPLPLYDHIQLALYMKMLDIEHGDLVECIYSATSRPTIRVSRVSIGVAPLSLPTSWTEGGHDIWTGIIVPRLYAFTAAVQKLRNEELLRLAFLNGTDEERLAIVRDECDFL